MNLSIVSQPQKAHYIGRKFIAMALAGACCASGLLGAGYIHADEEVVLYHRGDVYPGQSEPYHYELLAAIMKATEAKYGPVKLAASTTSAADDGLPRMRRLQNLIEGRGLDVIARSAQKRWIRQIAPIAIPTQKGVLGYRVFLTNHNNPKLNQPIKTLDDLKQLTVGGGPEWSSTRRFAELELKIFKQWDFLALTKALAAQRYDLLDRGAIEIGHDLAQIQTTFPNIEIEQNLVVSINMPVFFFVTPKKPELKKRIEEGLQIVIKNGVLDALFNQHFGKALTALSLHKRILIKTPNQKFGDLTDLDKPEYQLDLSRY